MIGDVHNLYRRQIQLYRSDCFDIIEFSELHAELISISELISITLEINWKEYDRSDSLIHNQ